MEQHPQQRADELQIENAATNEQLAAQNKVFKSANYGLHIHHYLEIVRHPKGANTKIREWIEQRAYYENKYKHDDDGSRSYHEADEQMISIPEPALTIG